MPFARYLSLIIAILPVLSIRATAETATSAGALPPEKTIQRLITELGNSKYEIRRQASSNLWAIGMPAEKALETAERSPDPEVSLRAHEILDKIRCGLDFNTSPDVAELIRNCRSGDYESRVASLKEALAAANCGARIVSSVIRIEKDVLIRSRLCEDLCEDLLSAVRSMLVRGDFGAAEEILKTLSAADDYDAWTLHLAAFYLLRGQIDGEIEKRKKQDGDPQQARQLVFLYRAKGQLKEAISVAKHLDDNLMDYLLVEAGEWKTLAKRSGKPKEEDNIESFGRNIIYNRLAGNSNELEKAVAALRKYAANDQVRAAWIFAACEGPERAIDFAVENGNFEAAAFLLQQQQKLDEILRLTDKLGLQAGEAAPSLTTLASEIRGGFIDRPSAPADFDDLVKDGSVNRWLAEVRRGHNLAAEKKWTESAKAFEKANECIPGGDPIALYLQGWALSFTDDGKNGRSMMDLASLFPLADIRMRSIMTTGLAQWGHKEAAQTQRELTIRLFPPYSPTDRTIYNTIKSLAEDKAFIKHDYTNAILLVEQLRVRTFSFLTGAISAEYRALAEIVAGNADKAVESLKEHRYFMMMPMLDPGICSRIDKLGHKETADRIFALIFNELEKLSEKHPDYVALHNNMAWFAARNRRSLEAGLKHARTAVEKAPDCSAYLDTLAEVQFQMGNTKEAIKLMKQCIELDPECGYFKRQLKRFESGDTKTDPEEQ